MHRPIGVFDSGMGGLSVLRTLRELLPCESFIYYGDNANAPYGEKNEEEIIRLTRNAVDRLLSHRIKALVIACNTATSAAATLLRNTLEIPVIGMEPALKPAQEMRHGGRILVMATPATLGLPKFASLMDKYGQGAIPVPIRGLVERIEQGQTDSDDTKAILQEAILPHLAQAPVDAVVLGCTHYLFARDVIAGIVGPDVPLVDGNEGTARQLQRLLDESNLLAPKDAVGKITLLTSGTSPETMAIMERLLYA